MTPGQELPVAILGTGRVGSNLALAVARTGRPVVLGARDTASPSALAARQTVPEARITSFADAAAGADLVVLAVPYAAVDDAVMAAGDLSHAIVVDATNPLGQPLPAGSASVLDAIAARHPDLTAVKAFNTIAAANYPAPVIDGRPAFLPIAGPQPAADRVADLAHALGFDALVIGDRTAAPLVERFAELYIHLAFTVGLGGDYAFARVTRPAEV